MTVKERISHSVDLTGEDKAILEKMGSFFEEFTNMVDNTFYFKGKEGVVYNIDNLYYIENFLSDFVDFIENSEW
jgi:hypothetical protein